MEFKVSLSIFKTYAEIKVNKWNAVSLKEKVMTNYDRALSNTWLSLPVLPAPFSMPAACFKK